VTGKGRLQHRLMLCGWRSAIGALYSQLFYSRPAAEKFSGGENKTWPAVIYVRHAPRCRAALMSFDQMSFGRKGNRQV
jgi:hypothetical protein